MAAYAASNCHAKTFNGTNRVWKQCGWGKVGGTDFCTRHQVAQKNGLWPIPGAADVQGAPDPDAFEPAPALQPPVQQQPVLPALPLAAPAPLNHPSPVAQPPLAWAAPDHAQPPLAWAAPAHVPPLCLLAIPWAEFEQQAPPKAEGPPEVDHAPVTKKRKLSPGLLAKCDNTGTGKHTAELRFYALFCAEHTEDLGQLPNIGKTVTTQWGKAFLSDAGVNAYLLMLQQDAKPRQVYDKFTSLKQGFRSLNLPASDLPAWCEHGASAPPMISQTFRDHKRSVAKDEAPVEEKGFVTPAHTQEFAVQMVLKHKAGEAPPTHLNDALMLWVMSGRSHRLVNVSNIKWADVGFHGAGAEDPEPQPPFMNILTTKRLGACSASQAAQASVNIRFTLGDTISKELFQAWWDFAPDDVKSDPDAYFFPSRKGDAINWQKAMGYKEVDTIVLGCAQFLGLVHSAEHAATFTSKSIRCGVAAETMRIVRGALSAINPKLGRAQSSKMELNTYSPASVFCEPGLLHSDLAEIDSYFQAALHETYGQKKADMLCAACGYPFCKCIKCISMANGGGKGAGSKHTCWLQGRVSGKKAKNSITETEAQFESRVAAWMWYGVQDMPIYQEAAFKFLT